MSGVARPAIARGPQWAAMLGVAVAASAADQLAKRAAAAALGLGERVELVGAVALTHVRNSGIAFGLFSGRTTAIALVTVVAVAALLVWFARSGAARPLAPAGFGLLLGGSLSNLTDRVRLSYAVDYLDFGAWPSFNLADVAIVAGVICLLAAQAPGLVVRS
jgi:signal peptidase II